MELLVPVICCLESILSKNQMRIAVYACRRVASGSKVAQLSVNRNGTTESKDLYEYKGSYQNYHIARK